MEADGRVDMMDLPTRLNGDEGNSHRIESRLYEFEAGREKLRGGDEYCPSVVTGPAVVVAPSIPITRLLGCDRPSLGEDGRYGFSATSQSEPDLDPGIVSRPERIAGDGAERMVSRVPGSTQVVSQLSNALTGDDALTSRWRSVSRDDLGEQRVVLDQTDEPTLVVVVRSDEEAAGDAVCG